MRSRDSHPGTARAATEWRDATLVARTVLEWMLRAISIVTLVLLLWYAVHTLRARPTAWARGTQVRAALASWSTREAPYHAHVVLDSVPTPDVRDWVAALAGAGTRTSWEGPALRATAVSAEPVADPTHPARVWVAAPNGSSLVLRDDLGVIDSVKTRIGGAVVTIPHLQGVARAVVDGTTASSAIQDSITVRPVLVLAIASWEGKFVMAGLEERGWQVDARFDVSPKVTGVVIQGPADVQIDTAHYAAVIALDTSATRYASAISDFVRHGGGFIAAGDAASAPAFASLMPATVGAPLPETAFQADTAHPRSALALAPLGHLQSDAIAVEARTIGKAPQKTEGRVAVVARRIGAGRVLQVGYRNTWRWRMGGHDQDPVLAYQQWWSAMVSSVAYAPRTSLAASAVVEPTPLASLVATLGAARPERPPRSTLLDDPRLLPMLFGLLMGALFLEWASRRLRGRS